MYELINTSVPNGLIPGTHGFATVAMTKGMPDAIRARVESLCAYPHRTSAHDASYFRENPVNWFHLTLPSGDHVVGRTAPADFDYTGRTNRLARTITFKKGEMPVSGGVAALRLTGSRLLEKWSGEPRTLAVDKVLSAKFFGAVRAKSKNPSNWIALFGDSGAALARRFAWLVEQNASGFGKSVYFKTSMVWDPDGTKLLGLFADLIDLLPDEIAPLVTFSTFAACVPSGTVCHLRGVYDSDRAFEVASGTQPWVDCVNGRVVHEELLPTEMSASATAKGNVSSQTGGVSANATASSSVRLGIRVDDNARRGQAAQNRANRWRDDMLARSNERDASFYKMLGVAAVLVLILAGVFIWWWLDTLGKSSAVSNDPVLVEALEEEAAEKAQAEKDKQINATVARTCKADEEAARRKQAEEAERAQQDVNQKAQEAARAEAQRAAEAAKNEAKEKKRQEEEKTKARSDNLEAGLDKLTITRDLESKQVPKLKGFEISDRKKSDAEEPPLLAKHAAIITNVDSVVVYYLENGTVRTVKCQYSAKHIRAIGTSPAKTKYEAKGWPDEKKLDKSPWVVCRVVNHDWVKSEDDTKRSLDVFWWWNDIPKQQLFAEKDEVNLAEICFGWEPAKKLWKKHTGQIFYAIRWLDKVWLQKEDVLKLSSFCDDKALQEKRVMYDKKITQKEGERQEKEKMRENYRAAIDKINKYQTLKENKSGKGVLTEKKEEVDKALLDVGKKNIPATSYDSVQGELISKVQSLDSTIEGLVDKIDKLKQGKENDCSKEKLEREVKNREFRIEVLEKVPDGMKLGLN